MHISPFVFVLHANRSKEVFLFTDFLYLFGGLFKLDHDVYHFILQFFPFIFISKAIMPASRYRKARASLFIKRAHEF